MDVSVVPSCGSQPPRWSPIVHICRHPRSCVVSFHTESELTPSDQQHTVGAPAFHSWGCRERHYSFQGALFDYQAAPRRGPRGEELSQQSALTHWLSEWVLPPRPIFRWLRPQPACDCNCVRDPKQERPSQTQLTKFLTHRNWERNARDYFMSLNLGLIRMQPIR